MLIASLRCLDLSHAFYRIFWLKSSQQFEMIRTSIANWLTNSSYIVWIWSLVGICVFVPMFLADGSFFSSWLWQKLSWIFCLSSSIGIGLHVVFTFGISFRNFLIDEMKSYIFVSNLQNRDVQALLPLTVKQINDAFLSSDDKSNFVIDGVDVNNVSNSTLYALFIFMNWVACWAAWCSG